MYNLLKRSSQSQNEWELNQGSPYDVSFLSDRVLERTDQEIKRQFISVDGTDFEALTKFPCLFTYEGLDVMGSIGRISEVRSNVKGGRITDHWGGGKVYH